MGALRDAMEQARTLLSKNFPSPSKLTPDESVSKRPSADTGPATPSIKRRRTLKSRPSSVKDVRTSATTFKTSGTAKIEDVSLVDASGEGCGSVAARGARQL